MFDMSFFCIISEYWFIAAELKLATNHYVQYQIFAAVIKLFLTLPPKCYHLNCCTLCDQRLNYIMASTYYIYAFVGLLWWSIMNMNSIHVATITYKELAYIFCESSTCLRYKQKIQDCATKSFFCRYASLSWESTIYIYAISMNMYQ